MVRHGEGWKRLHTGLADLHIHTDYSDGLHSPEEVVNMGSRAGLSWIAVTDHDTVDGLPEASAAADRLGIGFIPGVELSVCHQGQDFHILGYWIDAEDPDLQILLGDMVVARRDRVREMLNHLHGLGLSLSMQDVVESAGRSHVLGRPHVAAALVRLGLATTVREVFARYLGTQAPAYVEKKTVDPITALRVIRNAGGVPVLAHPGAYRLDGVLMLLVGAGLQGLESDYPKHAPDERAYFRRLAGRHGLVTTGGSDFHGGAATDIPVGGIRVDARWLDHLAARKEFSQ
jgi:predicted metal-dependent phosphoesterase TrpH